MNEFEPADFRAAYKYLELVELTGGTVDWQAIKHKTIYADLLLLAIIHRVINER